MCAFWNFFNLQAEWRIMNNPFCYSREPEIVNEKCQRHQYMQFSEKCLYSISIETLMTSDSSNQTAFLNSFHLLIL